MVNTKTIVLELRLSRNRLLCLLSVFFLAWHPAIINSETLTLTTYYPAPYGGYASILTTGKTVLARDSNSVGIGIGNPAAKLHVVGEFILDNASNGAGKVLTSDAAGAATWTTPSVFACSWKPYAAGTTTDCAPPAGNYTVLAARDAAGTLQPLGPPASLVQTGEMFCCKQ